MITTTSYHKYFDVAIEMQQSRGTLATMCVMLQPIDTHTVIYYGVKTKYDPIGNTLITTDTTDHNYVIEMTFSASNIHPYLTSYLLGVVLDTDTDTDNNQHTEGKKQ